MYSTTIMETSFPKAWERAVQFVSKSPLELKFGGGTEIKKARDSQVSIILDKNAVQEALNEQYHPSDPFCSKDKIKLYKQEYKAGFDATTFDYTYRDRLENTFLFDDDYPINQIDILRNGLQKQIDEGIGSNRNVAILFNPMIDNFSGKATPCFNEILVRWEGNNQCSVHTTFRSHDLASAWNANMLALTEFINEEVVKPCGCKIVYWSEHNFSLHIYKYNLSIVDSMIKINRNPQLINKQKEYDRIVASGLPLRWD